MALFPVLTANFPAFGRGLSLRPLLGHPLGSVASHFPAFGRGLSLRLIDAGAEGLRVLNFPAFGRGLSLRHDAKTQEKRPVGISPPSGGDFH